VETVILNDIPFRIDIATLLKRLHVEEGSGHANEIKRLADEAQALGKPKALYKAVYIEHKGDDYVVINGVRLTSRVLRVNLDQAYRVFPFVATCGTELEDWANSIGDILQRFWAVTIQEVALRAAMKAMNEHLTQHYRPGRTSAMSPGSLEDWPMEEQRPLFALLGDAVDSIGVRLTDTLLMIPTKSVSGIRFPMEGSFESCQLCPRERCPGRRAPYDPRLYDEKYREKT